MALCARIDRHGLIAAECELLTGGLPDGDGVARCASVDLVTRAAYVRLGLHVLAEARDLGSLVEVVAGLDLDADGFRVDLHDPSARLDRSSREVAIALADVIDADPDLRRPRHRFVVVSAAGGVVLAEVATETDAGYRIHDTKPWTTSSSLDARFARGLVNLVPGATSVLDPFCGAGSIVLEAASLGLEATGVDWKPAMVGMTRENLDHFGYSATVDRSDSRTVEHRADAVVTDLPYGHAIDGDEATIRTVLERCAHLAPRGVYVAPHDISDWLADAGHDVASVHRVVKRRGFTRHVHVTGSRAAGA
ncbi:TRM11 family SAM-dependent methyltransferase [Ilumatobacter sp.]|uniref:TRM11 family SAM-dependent methyltransferase n=1 Tax=Ilumatobacter sp. TaxID=1967498 RepID=UPI003B515BB9